MCQTPNIPSFNFQKCDRSRKFCKSFQRWKTNFCESAHFLPHKSAKTKHDFTLVTLSKRYWAVRIIQIREHVPENATTIGIMRHIPYNGVRRKSYSTITPAGNSHHSFQTSGSERIRTPS